ncbi:MAG TPA: type IV secretion system DNA-binding domain-containing protein [Candidatus Paceibacterota bacterium]|nr:type IV secretion system DNA-binding domain-containing protein [Candidatus Paceibacterota bacterium]
MMKNDRVTYFAETDFRNKRTPFGIKASDRTRHMYVIGKTGMGKSTLLENMAIQDIQNGEGMAFIDPHGATAEKLLSYIPKERIQDVVYFAPFDLDFPIAFNIMEDVGYDKRHLVANGLMSAFKKIWVDAWSARMEYILNNCILALLEYPNSTLLSVNRMLVDKEYRKKVVDNISDPSVRSFWVDEFSKYTDRYTQEATPAIQNKIGQFTANPLIRNIVGQSHSSFDIREAMDKRKIIIMNLSKGRMGEQNANLLGSMLVTKIYLSAMSRADLPAEQLAELPNVYFYVDEFQSFANESFADILSEARKYKLNLTIAHQYVEQMPEEVRAAVFGNVGTMVTFRVGSYDAEIFEKEFAPRFTAQDIVNLGFAQIYLRLMIDGIGSQPFSALTLPPINKPEHDYREVILTESRRHYAHPREIIETQIRELQIPSTGQQDASDTSDRRRNGGNVGRRSSNGNGNGNGREARDYAGRSNFSRDRRMGERRRNPAPYHDPWTTEMFGRRESSSPEPTPYSAGGRVPHAPFQQPSQDWQYKNTPHLDDDRRENHEGQRGGENGFDESRNFSESERRKNFDIRGRAGKPPRFDFPEVEVSQEGAYYEPVRNVSQEAISLNTLRKPEAKKKKDSPLKKALAAAIAEHEEDLQQQGHDNVSESSQQSTPSRHEAETSRQERSSENFSSQQQAFSHSQDFPEEVLKRILKVEEDEYRNGF